jgi:hypothetical protein
MPDIPMAGLALLLGIDPFMQRGRGLVNYIGNGVAAIAIAAWDKDLDVAELNRHLDLGSDGDIDADVASDGSMPHSQGEATAGDTKAASAIKSATGEPSATRQL